MVAIAAGASGQSLPSPTWGFFAYALVGGLAQILGNAVYIHLISAGNFTVITTYSKTETVLGALLSFIILDDLLSPAGMGGVLVTFLGVVIIAAAKTALTPRSLLLSMGSREALCGVGVGAFYAIGSTAFRGAILSLDTSDPLLASLFSLACVTIAQAVGMGLWLGVNQPAALRDTFRAWRAALWIGVTGAGASAAWFLAFALQPTAYVLAVGQFELVLAYAYSRFLFKERMRSGEIAGILVTLAGILTVALRG